ncbi:MAG: hypothetical protein JKY27_11815 [Magnetovibrio sp.]|nr:hypothetical protein [Magnetovibrio sp.]
MVALLLVAWRLASGPVSISFLTPYIENALAEVHQGAVKLAVDDTILTWAGWERTLDIRIINLRTSLANGEVIATVPEVSISLSAEALMKGAVAPRSVEFFGPSFNIVRHADGSFALGFEGGGEGTGDFASSMILLMLQDPDPSYAMSYLKRIAIIGGNVTYEDKAFGTVWHAPKADAEFIRTPAGLEAELDLDLKVGEKVAAISVMGSYSGTSKRIELGLSFDGVIPADFVALSQQIDVLSTLDLPMSGTITMSMEQNGRVEGVGFDLTGTKGYIALPVLMAAKINALDWAQRIGVNELRVSGQYEGATQKLDLSTLDVVLAPGESVYLPAPMNHDMALHSIKAVMSYGAQSGLLNIKDMQVTLASVRPERKLGPVAHINATVSGLVAGQKSSGLSVDFTGSVSDVAFDDLGQYWPKSLGADARAWVLDSLTQGIADQASLSVTLRPGANGTTQLVSLAGGIEGHGVTVDYISTMPAVTNASARATFTQKRFDITIDEGDGYKGLKIMGGTITLVNLQNDFPEAEISLDILGPVTSALELIDHQPLGFASELGIKPENAQGTVVAHINLQLPLKADLLAADVRAKADARLSGTTVKGALFQRDLIDGDLELAVTNDALELTGNAILGGVPVELNWNHDFRPAALFRDRYEISGTIQEVLNLGALGIEVPDILARYMHGGAQANVNYTVLGDGRQSLSARIDLANINLAAPELGWAKPVGVPGTAVLELRLVDGVPTDIPKFEVTAPDMDITGSASFLAGGRLQRIDLATMRSGKTDVAGSLTPLDDGAWELVLRGERLDASLLWDEMLGIRDVEPRTKVEDEDLMLNVAVDIRSLLIGKDRAMTDLIGTLYRRQGGWRKIDISGVVGETGSIELLLDTDKDGLRYLSIESDNAGAALSTLDLYDNILGGAFELKAAYTTPDKDAPLEGVVKVTDYAMIDAPAFAKLIGIMSLTGVLDALQGEGLNFDIFEAPFKLHGGVLELTDSRASGPTIGVTMSGSVDMDHKVMDMKGTVVPAYAINALLGKLPIIGELFTGREKGGGLFAATYTMKGRQDNVEIKVNPLSVLAPGVLRGIFTGADQKKPSREDSSVPPPPRAAPVEPVTPAPTR